MPKVERTGIYRNESGHAFFLRKGRIVGADILAAYALDESAELSPARQAIADAENGASVVADDGGEAIETPLSDEAAPASVAPVESHEVTTESYPAAVDEVAAGPAPVAPGGRRKRKNVETPEDAAPPVETPEGDDGKTYSEDRDGEDAG